MTPSDRRPNRQLFAALVVSVVLHGLPFLPGTVHMPASPPPPLAARLLPPPPSAAPELIVPDLSTESARASDVPAKGPQPRRERETPPRDWNDAVARQIRQQQKSGRFYSREAIARGLEGEVAVRYVLDENGSVVAARIEESSGHKILDDDALRAVRALRALPSDAPREGVLPLRFRLKD